MPTPHSPSSAAPSLYGKRIWFGPRRHNRNGLCFAGLVDQLAIETVESRGLLTGQMQCIGKVEIRLWPIQRPPHGVRVFGNNLRQSAHFLQSPCNCGAPGFCRHAPGNGPGDWHRRRSSPFAGALADALPHVVERFPVTSVRQTTEDSFRGRRRKCIQWPQRNPVVQRLDSERHPRFPTLFLPHPMGITTCPL